MLWSQAKAIQTIYLLKKEGYMSNTETNIVQEKQTAEANAVAVMQPKKLIAIIVAALVFLFFQFVCPVPTGLERTAMSAIGILLCCIVLWVTEAMPFIVTVVLIFFLIPVTGILPYSTMTLDDGKVVQSVFNQSSLLVPIYCLFVFTVSGAVMSTPIPYRVANVALKWAKGNSKKLIIGFTLATSVLSMFVSDLAASAIFIGIGLSIVEANGGIKGQSNLAKALTIAVGAGAAIGGIGTPIGNSLNILCMTMVEQYMQVRVTFLAWCIVNIPLALVTSFLSGLYVSKVFKIEDIKPEALTIVESKLADFGKMTAREIKLIVWFVIAFGLMILSTWFPQINSMLVAFIFCVIAFIPGIDLLTKKQFYANIPWEIIMMIIGVQALSTGLVGTGAANWFVNTTFAGAEAWPAILIVLVMCVVTMILHIAIPVGPPTVSVAVPLMVAVVTAVNGGVGAEAAQIVINPAVIACIGGILGGVTTWLPIDSIMMICYEKGWITMKEWVSRAWVSTVILLVLTVLWTPFICGIVVPA